MRCRADEVLHKAWFSPDYTGLPPCQHGPSAGGLQFACCELPSRHMLATASIILSVTAGCLYLSGIQSVPLHVCCQLYSKIV